MIILFDATKPVKSGRDRRFGFPLQLPKNPPIRLYSDSDAAWWAAECDAADDRRIDEAALEWAQTDSYCRGILPL